MISDKFDLEIEVQVPEFIMGHIGQVQRQDQKVENIHQTYITAGNLQKQIQPWKHQFKRMSSYGHGLVANRYLQGQQGSSDSQNPKNIIKNDKKNQSAKRYRQKKKQHIKYLQEQNIFLRNRVDLLSFRLNETQVALNKMKYNNQTHTAEFQRMKQKCLKQIQQLLSTGQIQNQKVKQIEKKFQDITCFDGKLKVNLLNYFMSQLIQNSIDDKSMYFLDCMLSKKGLYRQNKDIPLRKIDIQILQILDVLNNQPKQKLFLRLMSPLLIDYTRRFKQTWQSLYQSYSKLLNQGFLIQSLVRPFKQKAKNHINVSTFLKIQLYFQKIKYRQDIRNIRESWLIDFQTEENMFKSYQRLEPVKIIKI